MFENGVFRRRNLPHVDVEGKPTFITACLHGSIPTSGLREIRAYRDSLDRKPCPDGLSVPEWEMRKHKLVFKYVDSLLDGRSAVNHLADARLAEIVQSAFLHFADVRYYLYAFVVMPSHHHWLFLPKAEWTECLSAERKSKTLFRTPRESISHSIQSFTGNQCNRLLARKGAFWQTETFDHSVRDEAEQIGIITYIEQNPVVAGLVRRAEDYRWSSAFLRSKFAIPIGRAIPNPNVAQASSL